MCIYFKVHSGNQLDLDADFSFQALNFPQRSLSMFASKFVNEFKYFLIHFLIGTAFHRALEHFSELQPNEQVNSPKYSV